MNTLKFSKKSLLSTEQHNPDVHLEKTIKIANNNLKISIPTNLNIFITNKCNAKCFFCINHNYTNQDIDDELYYKSLNKTLEELDPNYFEITITGGEPTINKERFVKTLEICNQKGFKFRTISTNGLNLLSKYKGKELCNYLVENNAIHNINISRMSIDSNKEIMKAKTLSNEEIRKLANYFYMHDAEMRISCNLINGYVDNMDKIIEFVDYYRSIDVPTIMFRELVGEENQPIINDIFKPDKDFKKIDHSSDDIYEIDIYEYKDYIVKHYIQKKEIKNETINNLALRNGMLSINFNKRIIKDFRKENI